MKCCILRLSDLFVLSLKCICEQLSASLQHSTHAWSCQHTCLSLAHQSVWHATTLPEVLQNFRSIFMGVGALDYLDAWWKQTLKSAIRTLDLGDHITVSMWTSWVQLGRHWTVLWSSHRDACYPALPAALDMQRTDGGRVGGSQS